MVTTAVSKTPSFSETFYNSLFEVAEGERIRTCLQCATCSGVCPFGYIMDFPPGKMIALLRADMLDVHILLCLYRSLSKKNPINTRFDDPSKRATAFGG